jgi:hypothetical protein
VPSRWTFLVALVRIVSVSTLWYQGTVALRRGAFSPCTKQGKQTLQTPLNRTSDGLSHGFWASGWSGPGGPIANATVP